MKRLWPFALLAPLLVTLLVAFAAPVAMMLMRGVSEQELPAVMPRTAAALRAWDGAGLPSDLTAAAAAGELRAAGRAGTVNRIANRLNYDIVGSRSLIFATAARLDQGAAGASVADLARIDPRWGDRATWSAMRAVTLW